MVKAIDEDSLRQPDGFTEKWSSEGWEPVTVFRIFEMEPPKGYVCLGYAVATGTTNVPDPKQLR